MEITTLQIVLVFIVACIAGMDCKEIVDRTVLQGQPVERLFYRDHDNICHIRTIFRF